ncbi:acyltransferase [Paracoccus sp. IB05]|uniref:acyltransferase family protein n=1 Tax=Paracoccus sp. IB05 TaxID=2779367 RepID=UPI0018E74AE8|nr:acyltransferase [Paracoccus sp. IB05]MBJ2152691.1 acyltransferase [Paracoccus sp. IB05]
MRSKLNSIQVLRAYAALSVMVGHAILEAMTNHGVDPERFNEFPFIAGVDIFFVISGFIMYHTSASDFGEPGGAHKFLWRRFIRVVPLYWAFTSLMVVTLVFLSGSVRSTELEWWNVISSYLFIPSARESGKVVPILSLGWTLNYEIFFYVLFAAAMAFNRKVGVVVLLAFVAAFSIIGAVFQPSWAPMAFWTNSIILEFGFGVILAVYFDHIRRYAGILCCYILFIVGFVLLVFLSDTAPDLPRFIKGGIPAAIILCGCLTVPNTADARIPKFLLLLGDSSFALYLCHRFVMRPLTIFMGDAGGENFLISIAIYVIATTTISSIVAIVVFKYFETPLIKFLRSRSLGIKEIKPT